MKLLKIIFQQDEEESLLIDAPTLSIHAVTRALTSIQKVIDDIIDNEHNMTRSLKFKQDCEKAVHVNEKLYRDMIRTAKQKTLTDYFTYQ